MGNKEIINVQICRKKFDEEFKKEKTLDKSQKPVKICHVTANKHLMKFMVDQVNIRKMFYLAKEQMKKRVKFCNSILEKKITGQQIMFNE